MAYVTCLRQIAVCCSEVIHNTVTDEQQKADKPGGALREYPTISGNTASPPPLTQ